jgi:hypothetical protein
MVNREEYEYTPKEGFVLTHFLTVVDVKRSAEYYLRIFGGKKIDHFLDHISQFNVMVASFSINGHVPFFYKEQLKASNNQTLYPHHKTHMFRSL